MVGRNRRARTTRDRTDGSAIRRYLFCSRSLLYPSRELPPQSHARLTFRELEAFTRAGLAGLFALFHARIPAEQTLSFQRASEIAIDLKKGARDRQLRAPALPPHATAGGVNRQIVGIYCLGSLKRLQHDVL